MSRSSNTSPESQRHMISCQQTVNHHLFPVNSCFKNLDSSLDYIPLVKVKPKHVQITQLNYTLF